MTSRDRAIVYSALLALGVLNMLFLLGGPSYPALADAASQDAALASAESLSLTGEPALEIRNRDGRLSWSESPHAKAYSIAFVDVNSAVEKLLETPQFEDEREALTARIETERAEWLAKQQAIREQYQGITPDDPRAEQAQADFAEWQSGAQRWDTEMQEAINTMAVEQLERGYREVIEAVEVVADREGIDLVFRFTPPGDPLPTDLSGQTMLDIRMRTVVKHPEGLDMTSAVFEELGLTVE